MVFIPDDELKNKMKMDGSVLKFMRSAGGLGNGLIAGGLVFLIFGVLVGLLLMMVSVKPSGALIFAGILMAPGILMLVPGIVLKKKRIKNWMEGYQKASGLSREEILEAQEEFMAPGTTIISFDKSKSPGRLKLAGFVTDHYVKMPGVWGNMYRLDQVVACFFTADIDKEYESKWALVLYGNDPSLGFMVRDQAKEKDNLEIVAAITSRNPAIIKDRRFLYEGRQYDALMRQEEVIALHKRLMAQQA